MRLVCTFLLPLMACCQEARETVLSSRTPWPLVEMAQTLAREKGWPVDYEDPLYAFPGDLQAVGKGGKFLGIGRNPVTFTIPAEKTQSDAPGVIFALLRADELAGNPGMFKVIAEAGHFQIVPEKVRNSLGDLVTPSRVLDQPVTFPNALRKGSEIVQLVASQTHIDVATVPINYLAQTEMMIEADGEPARSVLLKMVNGLRRRPSIGLKIPTVQLVWRVLFVPDLRGPHFVFNMQTVPLT